jgi:hypothetical protein
MTKKQELKLRKLIREQLKKQLNEDFWRLPKKIIDNELYVVTNDLKSLYDSMDNDNDLKIEQLDNIIDELNKIKKKAKKFKPGTKPEKGY